MRALRVLGLAESEQDGTGKDLVCEDPSTGEQFSVPCDDRLRAGARGDLSRFGQLEIEMESQLRPKEIQARIRAGATVQQVASLAGTSTARVERFAFPVLLERASVTERAMKAKPAIDGITAGASVADTVAATLSARGHDGELSWDAFKDDDGWVLALAWSVGRSENRAHWLFHPGPDGGTLSARDDAAAEIVDPALRILRPLRPVRQDAVTAVLLDPTTPTHRTNRPSQPVPRPAHPAARSSHPAGSKLTNGAPTSRPATPSVDQPAGRGARFGAPLQPQARVDAGSLGQAERLAERLVEDAVIDERSAVNPVVAQTAALRTGTDPATVALPLVKDRLPTTDTDTMPVPTPKPVSVAAPAPSTPSTPSVAPRPARRGQRPAMPSWEDVLLGTRSTGN